MRSNCRSICKRLASGNIGRWNRWNSERTLRACCKFTQSYKARMDSPSTFVLESLCYCLHMHFPGIANCSFNYFGNYNPINWAFILSIYWTFCYWWIARLYWMLYFTFEALYLTCIYACCINPGMLVVTKFLQWCHVPFFL